VYQSFPGNAVFRSRGILLGVLAEIDQVMTGRENDTGIRPFSPGILVSRLICSSCTLSARMEKIASAGIIVFTILNLVLVVLLYMLVSYSVKKVLMNMLLILLIIGMYSLLLHYKYWWWLKENSG